MFCGVNPGCVVLVLYFQLYGGSTYLLTIQRDVDADGHAAGTGETRILPPLGLQQHNTHAATVQLSGCNSTTLML